MAQRRPNRLNLYPVMDPMTAMRTAAGSATPGASPKAAMPVAAVVCVCVCSREKEVRWRENAGHVYWTTRRSAYCGWGSFVFPRRLFGFRRFSFFVCFVVLFERKRRTTTTYYVKRKTGQSVRTR